MKNALVTAQLLATPAHPQEVMPDKWKASLAKLTIVPSREVIEAEKDEPSAIDIEDKAAPASTPPLVVENTAVESLPDLTEIPAALDATAFQAMKDEADRKKRWAQEAGPKKLALETELGALEGMRRENPDIVLSDDYRNRLAEVQAGLAKFNSVGDNLKKRVEFSQLVEFVRRCDGSSRQVFEHAANMIVAAGRFRYATKDEFAGWTRQRKLPPKTIVFEGIAYVPVLPPEGETPAQKLIQYEFYRLAQRAVKSRTAAIESANAAKIASMKQRGGDRKPDGIFKEEAGTYYLSSKSGKDLDDKLDEGGHVLVTLFCTGRQNSDVPIFKITILEALGYLSPMADKVFGATVIPLHLVKYGVKRRSDWSEAEFARMAYLARKLHYLIETNRKQA